MRPYSFSPFSLLDLDDEGGVSFVENLLAGGVVPITFGDVIHDGKGFRILSGDTISVELSRTLGAARCVMAMDVDGVLDADDNVIKSLDEETLTRVKRADTEDATGGMALKVREALRMASFGTEVRFVSGFSPAEFSKALRGEDFTGTVFPAKPV